MRKAPLTLLSSRGVLKGEAVGVSSSLESNLIRVNVRVRVRVGARVRVWYPDSVTCLNVIREPVPIALPL